MKKLILILLWSGLCFGQSAVPFRVDHNLILVEVEVDNHKSIMLFDSGAVDSYVNSSGGPLLHQVKGAHGFTGDVVLVHADVKVGRRLFSDLPLVSSNLDDMSQRIGVHLDGIIGQTILSQFSSVKIDYNRKTITFE